MSDNEEKPIIEFPKEIWDIIKTDTEQSITDHIDKLDIRELGLFKDTIQSKIYAVAEKRYNWINANKKNIVKVKMSVQNHPCCCQGSPEHFFKNYPYYTDTNEIITYGKDHSWQVGPFNHTTKPEYVGNWNHPNIKRTNNHERKYIEFYALCLGATCHNNWRFLLVVKQQNDKSTLGNWSVVPYRERYNNGDKTDQGIGLGEPQFKPDMWRSYNTNDIISITTEQSYLQMESERLTFGLDYKIGDLIYYGDINIKRITSDNINPDYKTKMISGKAYKIIAETGAYWKCVKYNEVIGGHNEAHSYSPGLVRVRKKNCWKPLKFRPTMGDEDYKMGEGYDQLDYLHKLYN